MSQSAFSDPGPHAALLDDLPDDVSALLGDAGAGPDWRRVADLLDADQRRYPGRPLTAPRADPVGASTRAASLLVVAARRRRGVPARCRVGFAPRLGYAPRVIATPRARDDDGFVLAGEVWLAYREGVVDAARYGGGAAVRDAVLRDLAHANADEVPLADTWGSMGPDLVGDLDVVDELAALLVATFLGDEVADRELAERYASDHRIRPPHALARAA